MSRSMSYSRAMSLNLGPIERCLIAYYVRNYRATKGDVIRTMINRYCIADKAFGPEEFLAFVKEDLAPKEAQDDGEAKELVQAAENFVRAHHRRHTEKE
jgi:hypothetical protein